MDKRIEKILRRRLHIAQDTFRRVEAQGRCLVRARDRLQQGSLGLERHRLSRSAPELETDVGVIPCRQFSFAAGKLRLHLEGGLAQQGRE